MAVEPIRSALTRVLLRVTTLRSDGDPTPGLQRCTGGVIADATATEASHAPCKEFPRYPTPSVDTHCAWPADKSHRVDRTPGRTGQSCSHDARSEASDAGDASAGGSTTWTNARIRREHSNAGSSCKIPVGHMRR